MKVVGKLFWVFLLLFCNIVLSQVTISGTVKDTSGNIANGVTVTVTKIDKGDILGYAITDFKGKYSIKIISSENKVRLEFKSINYGSKSEIIENKTQKKDVVLDDTKIELKGIVIRSSPIHRKGDTINYSVKSFAKKQDRSIADVLKRMPGIEVESDGRVLYQGKPINKYYIEGLDLLQGRYGIVNESLPHKEVAKVQVLENHQPIKVLDSLEYSENAALNIKLKNAYTFTGKAELGTGFSPLLWLGDITPMLFTKRQQLLISYKANNIGEDVSKQLEVLSLEDLLDNYANIVDNGKFLNIGQVSFPDFSEKRWLDNNINLLTANYLYKFKNNYEIKLNTSYINNYTRENASSSTIYYMPEDTVKLLEKKSHRIFENALKADITLLKNTNKNYFKNNIKFESGWDNIQGNGVMNNNKITQRLKNNKVLFANNLKTIFSFGKQLITLKSNIVYNESPEELFIIPGQFEGLLNKNKTFDKLEQSTKLKRLFADNYLKFNKRIFGLKIAFKSGFSFQNQTLLSNISTSSAKKLNADFANNLKWYQAKPYANFETDYEYKKFRFIFNTLLSYNNYKIYDEKLLNSQTLKETFLNPNIRINYSISPFLKLETNVSLNSVNYGEINKLHYAYILKNYKNIQRINTILPRTAKHSFSGKLVYENAVKAIFGTLSYDYSVRNKNLLYKTNVLESGVTEIQGIEKENQIKAHRLSVNGSKYFNAINTMLSLKGLYSLQYAQRMINDRIVDVKNENYFFNASLDIDLSDKLNLEYNGQYFIYKNKIEKEYTPSIHQQSHKINLNFFLKQNHFVGLQTEYLLNNDLQEKPNNFFADLTYRFTWEKRKIDFELQCNNIFNTKEYATTNIIDFVYASQSLKLRPRQFLFKVKFSF